MAIKYYNKLVRDKIPEIIKKGGGEPKYYQANANQIKTMLIYKLQEEVSEFKMNPTPEELADIQEVVDAIAYEFGWAADHFNKGAVREAREEKFEQRGGFYQRYILTEVREDD